jgi:DNA primase
VLFNLNRVEATAPTIIVVEGFFDCMNVHQSGFPSVVALMGSSMSEAQRELLCQFKQIVLFLDGDNAGRQATATIAPELMSRAFVRVVELPDGRQPDQLSSDEMKTFLLF